MHAMPYLIKNSAGSWCVQKRVPEQLQAAVARVLGSKKQTQVYLKKSLGTKDRREAARRAPHALADLDRTLREAEALSKQQPAKRKVQQRTTVNDAEIKRIGEYVYARVLAWDDAGVWLPLLALFGGSRQAEFAGLRVTDIREDEKARYPLMWFTRDRKAGRRLKTKTSERVVP